MKNKIIIFVGMMGVGKTTVSKRVFEIDKSINYVDFDYTYHNNIDNKDKDKSSEMIDFLSNFVKKGNNYVIDGWFTWTRNWYLIETDNSLSLLKERIKEHDIELVLLNRDKEDVIKSYFDKHYSDLTDDAVITDYRETYDLRLRNLLKKADGAMVVNL